jgi:hypothetical protein
MKSLNDDGRSATGAQPGQGRGDRSPAAASAASLEGAHRRAGYAAATHRGRFYPERVPLTAVLARYGLLEKFRRSGGNLVGCCPLHHGTQPRQFNINPRDSTWYCFGDCNRGGGVLDFVAGIENISISAAAVLVADWFALPPTAVKRRRPMTNKPTHKVLAVTERPDGDNPPKSYFTRIGAAWPIKNGSGLSLQLEALPLNGRLVLLEVGEDENVTDNTAARTTKR